MHDNHGVLPAPGMAAAPDDGELHSIEGLEAAARYVLLPEWQKLNLDFDKYLEKNGVGFVYLNSVYEAFGTRALGCGDIPHTRVLPSPARLAAIQWHDSSSEERSGMDMESFARERGISHAGMKRFVSPDGQLRGEWSGSLKGAFRSLAAASHARGIPQHTPASEQGGQVPSATTEPSGSSRADQSARAQESPAGLRPAEGHAVDPACPRQLDNSDHPDHALYLGVRRLVSRMFDEREGVTAEQCDRVAGVLTVAARATGMGRIDKILRDQSDTAWGVQQTYPGCNWVSDKQCVVQLDGAKQTSVEESARLWPQAMEQFERLARLELQPPQQELAIHRAMGPR